MINEKVITTFWILNSLSRNIQMKNVRLDPVYSRESMHDFAFKSKLNIDFYLYEPDWWKICIKLIFSTSHWPEIERTKFYEGSRVASQNYSVKITSSLLKNISYTLILIIFSRPERSSSVLIIPVSVRVIF